MAKFNKVPTYALFGETADFPEILHCELIEHRAKMLDWTISVHQHSRLIQLFFVVEGGGKMSLDGEDIELGNGMCAIVPQNVPHSFKFIAQTKGWVITIPKDTADALLVLTGSARTIFDRKHVLRHCGDLELAFCQLATIYQRQTEVRQTNLCASLLILIGQLYEQCSLQLADELSLPISPLISRYKSLVEKHCVEHLSVTQYATRLNITPTHLNRLCQQQLGVGANKVIENQIVQLARRALAYTRADISQVGFELGFADPAYFSRMFKRATGHAPSAFRAAYNQ